MTAKNPKPVEQSLCEREDDARELQAKPQRQTLATRIEAFLSGTMNANDADVFSKTHSEAIALEIAAREQAARQKRERDEEKATALFNNKFTKADAEAADAEILKFIRKHPNFRRDIPSNVAALLNELKLNMRLVTLANLEAAYESLRQTGVFQTSTPEEQRVSTMSADQFKASCPELADNRTPPIAWAAVEKVLDTFRSFHPEYVASSKNATMMMGWLSESGLPPTIGNLNAAFDDLRQSGRLELTSGVMQSGATSFVDYGYTRQQHGVPMQPVKASFRALVRDLTANELRQRMLDDPKFESALDNLNR